MRKNGLSKNNTEERGNIDLNGTIEGHENKRER